MGLGWLTGIRRMVTEGRRGANVVRHRSRADNIYHCCVHKTGSQWIRALLSDTVTYRYSGLRPFTYQASLEGRYDARRLTERRFTEPFPRETIVTPLYIDFDNFLAIPKPGAYRAFFVMRDPRDIVVSWYFSAKTSHAEVGGIGRIRQELGTLSTADGIRYALRHMQDRGHFTALDSWREAEQRDPDSVVVRFEDLTSGGSGALCRMLAHCDVQMPPGEIERLSREYSFERLSGRRRGEEDEAAHYRKGIAGDWKNHFDDRLRADFETVAPGLVDRLGYRWD